jgi:hypothetical protein
LRSILKLVFIDSPDDIKTPIAQTAQKVPACAGRQQGIIENLTYNA